jgi:hypothetical protein
LQQLASSQTDWLGGTLVSLSLCGWRATPAARPTTRPARAVLAPAGSPVTRRAPGWSMIPKSVQRFSEKIMLKQ